MKVKKTLDKWDWTTLVAAWRYYEHRSTSTAAAFPALIVARFFDGQYAEEDCRRIARLFVEVDHATGGEAEWSGDDVRGLRDWCKLYAFLKAYLDGWKTVRGVEYFYCETTERWYPKNEYVKYPWLAYWVAEERLKEVAE